MAVEKNIKWKRVEAIGRMLGRLSIAEKGEGTKFLGKKIKIFNNVDWEEYQVVGNFASLLPNFPCYARYIFQAKMVSGTLCNVNLS